MLFMPLTGVPLVISATQAECADGSGWHESP